MKIPNHPTNLSIYLSFTHALLLRWPVSIYLSIYLLVPVVSVSHTGKEENGVKTMIL